MSHRFTVDLTADGHVHTRMCRHASGEMEDYVKAALVKGLRSITFLEHLEVKICTRHRTWLTADDFNEYFRQGTLLKKKYGSHIEILLGVEVGYNSEESDTINQLLITYPWESIGLSYHFFPLEHRHFNMVSRNPDHLTALEEIGFNSVAENYFMNLNNALDYIVCDKICHLDAILRYVPDFKLTNKHLLLIDTLLARMKKKGISLEINTSGYTIRDQPHPCAQIIKRALNLAIPLVVGSDAHHPWQVGRFFNLIPDWLRHAASLS